jgi:hypothetical protein
MARIEAALAQRSDRHQQLAHRHHVLRDKVSGAMGALDTLIGQHG